MDSQSIPLVILAAGLSTRMGEAKALLKHRGDPWIIQQIRTFRKYSLAPVVIVVGKELTKYNELFSSFSNIQIIENNKQDLGTFYSIHLAFNSFNFINGAFIKPVDVPLENNNIFRGITDFIEDEDSQIVKAVLVRNANRGGHPIYLAREFIEQLKYVDVSNCAARLDLQIKSLAPEEKNILEFDEDYFSKYKYTYAMARISSRLRNK